MTRSNQDKITPHRIRAALTLAKTSVPQIARKHGCKDKTLYAVIHGDRPGRDPKVRQAIADIEVIMKGVLYA